jgi:hypothetical protein
MDRLIRSAKQRGVFGRLMAAVALAYATQVVCFPANFNGAFFQGLLGLAPWLASEGVRLGLGVVGYLLAMTLFAWDAEHGYESRGIWRSARLTRARMSRAGWALVVLALVLWGWNLARFWNQGEDALTRWAWLGALAVLLGGLGMLSGPRQVAPSPKKWGAWGWLTLAAVLLVAAWFRFWRLDVLPADLHGDMASMGLQAWVVSQGWFRLGWAGIPALGFAPAALGLHWFPRGVLALAALPAAAGWLSVLGLWFLAWQLFDSRWLGVLAAGVLAVNIPHGHFSRLAAYMDPWPWMLWSLGLLVWGWRRAEWWALGAAGGLLGIGLQMYFSGRGMVVILPVVALWVLARNRGQIRFWLLASLAVVAGLLLALGPMMVVLVQEPAAIGGRTSEVVLWHPPVMQHLMGKYGVRSPAAVLWQQLKASVLMFNFSEDSSTQFGFTGPMFSAMLSPLIWLGVALSLRRWRRPRWALGLVWMGGLMVSGSVLTNNAPFWPRLVGILPVAALMAGLSLMRIWQVAGSWRQWMALVLMLGFVLLAWRNWQVYEAFVADNARPAARIGRYLATLPEDVHACSFAQPYALNVRATRFLARPRALIDLPVGVSLLRCPGPQRVWILPPEGGELLASVQRQWPQGVWQVHEDSAGRPVFGSYFIPAPAHDVPAGEAALTRSWQGDDSSQPVSWRFGPVQVTGRALKLCVEPLAGHDAVVDFVELLDVSGRRHRFEGEDGAFYANISPVAQDGLDHHWWLQRFPPFSQGGALVARKDEFVAPIIYTLPLAPGLYDLRVGTFSGDAANGAFGLVVTAGTCAEDGG